MNKDVFENKNWSFECKDCLFSYSLLDRRWLLFVFCGSSGVVEGKFSLMNQGVGVKIITSRNIVCLVEDDGFSG